MRVDTGGIYTHHGHYADNQRDHDRLNTVRYYFYMIYLKLKKDRKS